MTIAAYNDRYVKKELLPTIWRGSTNCGKHQSPREEKMTLDDERRRPFPTRAVPDRARSLSQLQPKDIQQLRTRWGGFTNRNFNQTGRIT